MSNRLAQAQSPYLQQHADNPVDWQEWGPEAFEEARRREVPILLSVGYAACHWCHLMRCARILRRMADDLGIRVSAGAVLCQP